MENVEGIEEKLNSEGGKWAKIEKKNEKGKKENQKFNGKKDGKKSLLTLFFFAFHFQEMTETF